MLRQSVGFTFLALMIAAACVVECGLIHPRTEPSQYPGEPPKKRPFCNAFTGCGRKRAANMAINSKDIQNQQQNNIEDDIIEGSLGDLLDLNSEPAVEDLIRQIMSQAKLWEAIQEANREMTILKNDRYNANRKQFPAVAFNAQ